MTVYRVWPGTTNETKAGLTHGPPGRVGRPWPTEKRSPSVWKRKSASARSPIVWVDRFLTISREVAANGGRDDYRAWAGQRRARGRARRPKPSKLGSCLKLRHQVEEWLSESWSPEEIAERLGFEFPNDPMMRVSYETIYKTLFVQGRGEPVGNWPAACAVGRQPGGLRAASNSRPDRFKDHDQRTAGRGRGPGGAGALGG